MMYLHVYDNRLDKIIVEIHYKGTVSISYYQAHILELTCTVETSKIQLIRKNSKTVNMVFSNWQASD